MQTIAIDSAMMWEGFTALENSARTFRKVRSGRRLVLLVIIGLCVGLWGCGTVKVSGRHEIGAITANKPKVIYVADFELEAANVKSERGIVPLPSKLPGPLGDALPPMPGSPKDSQVVAGEVVETMSSSLVKELTKSGLDARRLSRGQTLPTSGWIVRGVFTEVNQGNQLHRAMIGFGSGKTDLQAVIDISDLSQGAPKKFYELAAAADSGKAPGAAPMIALCPAGAAARFVIAGQDLNRNVKQTASKIAAEVVQKTKPVEVRSTAAHSSSDISDAVERVPTGSNM